MGYRLVQQPNGLLAVYSSVCDDFILLSAGVDDLVDILQWEMSRRDIFRMIAKALDLRSSVHHHPNTPRYPWGESNWESLLADIRERHGEDRAEKLSCIGTENLDEEPVHAEDLARWEQQDPLYPHLRRWKDGDTEEEE